MSLTLCILVCFVSFDYLPEADPGFIDRGLKFTKRGLDLLNLHDLLSIFPDFSENSP